MTQSQFQTVLSFLVAIDQKLNLVLTAIAQGESLMSSELQALTDQVAKNTTVEASAIALIQGIADKLAHAQSDPTQINGLAAQLKNSADALAAAVAANTPAAPAAPATPAS